MIFYTSTPDYYNDYIAHFGILGMKWGKRNGPPYPLGSNVSTGRRLKNVGSVNKKKTSSKVTTYKDPDGNSWKISGTPNKETQKRIKEYEKAKKQAKAYVNLPTPKSVYMPNPELAKRAKEIGDKEVHEVAKGKPIKNIKSPETGFAQKEIDKKNQQPLTINKASMSSISNPDYKKKVSHYLDKSSRKSNKELMKVGAEIYNSSPEIIKANEEYLESLKGSDEKAMDKAAEKVVNLCNKAAAKYLGDMASDPVKGHYTFNEKGQVVPMAKNLALANYIIYEVNKDQDRKKKG